MLYFCITKKEEGNLIVKQMKKKRFLKKKFRLVQWLKFSYMILTKGHPRIYVDFGGKC